MSRKTGRTPQKRVAQHQQHSQQLKVEVSPFLLPETLKQYESVQKGFAERTIKMFEGEQEHRQFLEKKNLETHLEFNKLAINNEYKVKRFGQNATTCIALIGLVGGMVLVFFNKPIGDWRLFYQLWVHLLQVYGVKIAIQNK